MAWAKLSSGLEPYALIEELLDLIHLKDFLLFMRAIKEVLVTRIVKCV